MTKFKCLKVDICHLSNKFEYFTMQHRICQQSEVLDLSDTKDSTTPSTEELPMGRHTGDATYTLKLISITSLLATTTNTPTNPTPPKELQNPYHLLVTGYLFNAVIVIIETRQGGYKSTGIILLSR